MQQVVLLVMIFDPTTLSVESVRTPITYPDMAWCEDDKRYWLRDTKVPEGKNLLLKCVTVKDLLERLP